MYVVCVYCIWKSILCLYLVADCNLLDQRRLELNSAEMRTKHGFSPQKFQMAEIVMQSGRDSWKQIQPKVPVVSPGFEMLAQCSKCRTMLSNQPFWSQLCTVILPLTVQYCTVVMYTCQLQWCSRFNCSLRLQKCQIQLVMLFYHTRYVLHWAEPDLEYVWHP